MRQLKVDHVGNEFGVVKQIGNITKISGTKGAAFGMMAEEGDDE